MKYKLVNLAIRNRLPLHCWIKGILVMLEKKPKVVKVTKLRAILLLEANFNGVNKILFNTRLIPLMEQAHVIPKEIISGRRVQLAIQLAVNKNSSAILLIKKNHLSSLALIYQTAPYQALYANTLVFPSLTYLAYSKQYRQ